MYPIALDLKRIPILLTGKGELLERRLKQLKDGGATEVAVFNAEEKSPAKADITKAKIVLATGLSLEESEKLAKAAKAAGKLVNIEDVSELCDFYFTANIVRGDLIIAVSTSGASPTLARKVRDWIAQRFGPEWAQRTSEISSLRQKWKAEGKDMKAVLAASEAHIAKKRWLA